MVRAESEEFYHACLLVYPKQQEVVLHMALHASLEDAVQHVRLVLLRYSSCLLEVLGHCLQRNEF